MPYYAEFNIVKPLYSMKKRISASTLNVGDRFLYGNHKNLLFKTDAKSDNGKYLCCDDGGRTKLIDGKEIVTRINGIGIELRYISGLFKDEYLKQEAKRKGKKI
jgi:hypothetical protein